MLKKKNFFGVLCMISILVVSITYYFNSSSPKEVILQASWADYYENVQSLVDDSDFIALVEVSGPKNTFVTIGNIPLTNYEGKVITALKGCTQNEKCIIVQTGGIVDNQMFLLEDDPPLVSGEQYFIFGRFNDYDTITILGGPQGRFVCQNNTISSLNNVSLQTRYTLSTTDIFVAPELNLKKQNLSEFINLVHRYL